jgi:hypothetical protein
MRRATLIVDFTEASESGFRELYRRYLRICAEEGVDPMPQPALRAILLALAVGEETGERDVTHH